MDEMIYENIGWNTKLSINPDYILREIGDESVVVPVVDSGPFENSMFTLNDTSAWLWRHFAKGATPAEVLETAYREFESENGDPEFIKFGIYRFVLESADLKILQLAEGQG